MYRLKKINPVKETVLCLYEDNEREEYVIMRRFKYNEPIPKRFEYDEPVLKDFTF